MSDAIELSADDVRTLEFCAYCPRLCHFACPAAHGDASETATPWGMMTLANMIRRGEVVPSQADATNLARCTSCARCTAFCRHENDVAGVLQRARSELHRQGWQVLPDPVPATWSRVDAGVVYVADALTSPDERGLAEDVVALLTRLLGEEVALHDATASGIEDTFEAGNDAAARRAVAAIEASLSPGARVLTDSVFFAERCGRADHVLSMLQRRSSTIASFVDASEAIEVAFHGGCRERRVLDLEDAERDLLAAVGVTLTDVAAIDGEHECCGARGTYRCVSEAGAARAARTVAEIGDVEREMITSSARCAAHMRASSERRVASTLRWVVDRCRGGA